MKQAPSWCFRVLSVVVATALLLRAPTPLIFAAEAKITQVNPKLKNSELRKAASAPGAVHK
jgi:hypothetical protein